MPISWVPVKDKGKLVNFRLIGEGFYVNDGGSLMKQGTFDNNGRLNSNNCEVYNYQDVANVSIRRGSYSRDKENGAIMEYVFPKGKWEEFINNIPVKCTRYQHIFTNGEWSATNETKENVSICGDFQRENNRWKKISFSEN